METPRRHAANPNATQKNHSARRCLRKKSGVRHTKRETGTRRRGCGRKTEGRSSTDVDPGRRRCKASHVKRHRTNGGAVASGDGKKTNPSAASTRTRGWAGPQCTNKKMDAAPRTEIGRRPQQQNSPKSKQRIRRKISDLVPTLTRCKLEIFQ
jgi:hypothetical protein